MEPDDPITLWTTDDLKYQLALLAGLAASYEFWRPAYDAVRAELARRGERDD